MTVQTPDSNSATVATRVRNLLLVAVAIVLATAVFLGLRAETSPANLSNLAEDSTPLEVAMDNGKPTLMEFYANWCTTCQAMAPEIRELETEYADDVNFVMLNVDNRKWLPELSQYRVDGIPHFVYLNRDGEAIAQTIGEQPQSVMAENLTALVAGDPLPHAKATGRVSKFDNPQQRSNSSDPRSHGSQVVPSDRSS